MHDWRRGEHREGVWLSTLCGRWQLRRPASAAAAHIQWSQVSSERKVSALPRQSVSGDLLSGGISMEGISFHGLQTKTSSGRRTPMSPSPLAEINVIKALDLNQTVHVLRERFASTSPRFSLVFPGPLDLKCLMCITLTTSVVLH